MYCAVAGVWGVMNDVLFVVFGSSPVGSGCAMGALCGACRVAGCGVMLVGDEYVADMAL